MNLQRFLRNDTLIPVMVAGVSEYQKLGQQDKAHGLLLDAGKILSEHGPESLSSECQTDYCLWTPGYGPNVTGGLD